MIFQNYLIKTFSLIPKGYDWFLDFDLGAIIAINKYMKRFGT